MVKPETSTLSPAPKSYYSLSDMSKMTAYDTDEFSTPLDQSTPFSTEKHNNRIEKGTSFVSDDEFSEPYIMDDIDEVCKNADLDSVPRRRGARKPRPASWCGATQLIRDEDPNDFDPDKLKQLQESLKQADMEREVILSCLGKEYIERVTLQSHLQSICSKFGYRLEDLIIQKSAKEDLTAEKDTGDNKQTALDERGIVHKSNDGRRPVFLDDTTLGMRRKNNGVIEIAELAREDKVAYGRDGISDNARDTITKFIEAEQRKSTMKFSHALSSVAPQLSEKELSSSSYMVQQTASTKTTLEETLNKAEKSSARVVLDSNFQATNAISSKDLSMGNKTKDSTRTDQLASSKINGQVFSNTKQERGQVDYTSIDLIKGHPSNLRKCSERSSTETEISTTIAGDLKRRSIEICGTDKSSSTAFKMDDSTHKQRMDNDPGFDNMNLQISSKGEIVDEGIVELKEFLTDLIEENQKAAKRIVLLEKRMAKDGGREEFDTEKSESISGASRRSFLSRRSYTTDDVQESSVHGLQKFVRSQKRRSSFSESRTSHSSLSAHNRLFKSTLSSQQKMKPPLQRKKSRSSDSLASTAVDAVDYDRHRALSDHEGGRPASKSPDVKEIVVTNDDNMKTVFCQASYDTNTFQYIYTIDAEMSNKEYNKLLSIINMLQEQRRKWETEVRELQSKVDILGKDKIEVVRNNNLLRQSLEAANKAIREINSKVQELKRTIVPLRDDNAKLKEQNQTFRIKFDTVRKEKLKLVQEIQELKKMKVKMEEKISSLEKREEIRKIGRIVEETSLDEKEDSLLQNQNTSKDLDGSEQANEVSLKSTVPSYAYHGAIIHKGRQESLKEFDTTIVTTRKAETLITHTTASESAEATTAVCTPYKNVPLIEDSKMSMQHSEETKDKRLIRKHSVETVSCEDVQSEKQQDSVVTDIVNERNTNHVTSESSCSLQLDKVKKGTVDTGLREGTLTQVTDLLDYKKHDKLGEDETSNIFAKGIVSQQVQKLEKQEEVSSQAQIIQSTQVHNETNIVQNQSTNQIMNRQIVYQAPDTYDGDSRRLRDIEVQNETLMTELQNLRNRLQAYEETVANMPKASQFDETVEVNANHEVQSIHEDLIATSEGTIRRQLEKEEEHLIDELTRRSPMSDRGRVSACQSSEDISRNRDITERSLKRRSLEIVSLHPKFGSSSYEEGRMEEARRSPQTHSKQTGVTDMARWASFSQDSLLDVREYSTKARFESDDQTSGRSIKQPLSKRVVHIDGEDGKAKAAQYSDKKLDHLRGQQGQTIGSGYARFSTKQPVSMVGESRDVSGGAKFRAEIKIKDFSLQSEKMAGHKRDDQVTALMDLKVDKGDGVQVEAESRSESQKSYTTFSGRVVDKNEREERRQTFESKERHESLTDKEVQEITLKGTYSGLQKGFDNHENNHSVKGEYNKRNIHQVSSHHGAKLGKTSIRVNAEDKTMVTNTQNITRSGGHSAQQFQQHLKNNEFIENNQYREEQNYEQKHRRTNQTTETVNGENKGNLESSHAYESERKRGLIRPNVIETQVTTTTEYITKTNSADSYALNVSDNENYAKRIEADLTHVSNQREPSKKPLKGILTDRSKSASHKVSKHAHIESQSSKTLAEEEEERSAIVSESSIVSSKGTMSVGRLLDSKGDRRNDVVRGARGRDLYSTSKSEFVEEIVDGKVARLQESEQISRKEVKAMKSENSHASYHEIEDHEKWKEDKEKEVKKSQTQQFSSMEYENKAHAERNSSNVLYLDELTEVSAPPGSLGRSRRTRSLRMRPNSDMYTSRLNGDVVHSQYHTGHATNNFQRFGSVRSKREWDRERMKRENMSLSLSESNLLFKSGVDGAIRQVSRHVHGDQHYTTDHITNTNGTTGHVHYHSQEILKADATGMNQVLTEYCNDPNCRAGSSTLPKSSRNLRASAKFNCEMCKQMSRRKHSTENKYCREKYFPIAHTDFV